MADTIRTGIVGATVTQGGSGWGANAHVPALHLLPDYTLQAVCTAHEDTAQASKAKFDAVHAFHDIDAMAQHPEIDLVVVCVRVPGHKNLVMAGLHANKAVFCEWPLGATLAEALAAGGLRPGPGGGPGDGDLRQGARPQDHGRPAGAQRPDADVRP